MWRRDLAGLFPLALKLLPRQPTLGAITRFMLKIFGLPPMIYVFLSVKISASERLKIMTIYKINFGLCVYVL